MDHYEYYLCTHAGIYCRSIRVYQVYRQISRRDLHTVACFGYMADIYLEGPYLPTLEVRF